MTALKGLALTAALLVSTTSLAMAQAQGSSGPDGQVTTSAAAADNPGPARSTSHAARRHGTMHHRMYLSAKGAHHKTMKTGQQLPKQPKP
jgi:hypothetical protein